MVDLGIKQIMYEFYLDVVIKPYTFTPRLQSSLKKFSNHDEAMFPHGALKVILVVCILDSTRKLKRTQQHN